MENRKQIRQADNERLAISRAYVPGKEQLKALFRSASTGRYKERNTLILCLSYYAGLRCSEIAALKISQCYEENGDPKGSCVIRGKGGKTREIYLNAMPTQQALVEYASYESTRIYKYQNEVLVRNQSKNSFDSLGMCKLLKQIHKQGNLPQCSSHSGRRWFITNVIYKTGNIGLAKQYAGHSDIRTTMLYFEDNPHLKRQVAANIHK